MVDLMDKDTAFISVTSVSSFIKCRFHELYVIAIWRFIQVYDQFLSKKPFSESEIYTVGPSPPPLTKLPQITHPRLWPSFSPLGPTAVANGQKFK